MILLAFIFKILLKLHKKLFQFRLKLLGNKIIY